MKKRIKYWESVAKILEEKLQKGDPKNWDQQTIQFFLIQMEEKIRLTCQNDKVKAQLCGIPLKNGKYQIKNWSSIDSTTFRKIFNYLTSTGSKSTKEQFAIFLDYNSSEELLNQVSLESVRPLAKKTIDSKTSKSELFKKLSLLKVFRWMLFWLAISSLIHNGVGLLKGEMQCSIYWPYIFWLPPILVSTLTYCIAKNILTKVNNKLKTITLFWWFAIISLVLINQIAPQWPHFIQLASLLWIGIVGQFGLSTKLVFVVFEKYAEFNQKYTFVDLFIYNVNFALLAYFIALCIGLLLIPFIWITPGNSLMGTESIVIFKLYVSFEMIISFFLISIGFRKLVFNPIAFLNT